MGSCAVESVVLSPLGVSVVVLFVSPSKLLPNSVSFEDTVPFTVIVAFGSDFGGTGFLGFFKSFSSGCISSDDHL